MLEQRADRANPSWAIKWSEAENSLANTGCFDQLPPLFLGTFYGLTKL